MHIYYDSHDNLVRKASVGTWQSSLLHKSYCKCIFLVVMHNNKRVASSAANCANLKKTVCTLCASEIHA